jgi:hypothetical protein
MLINPPIYEHWKRLGDLLKIEIEQFAEILAAACGRALAATASIGVTGMRLGRHTAQGTAQPFRKGRDRAGRPGRWGPGHELEPLCKAAAHPSLVR